jgi:glutamyl-tRNA synthetase
MPLDDFISASTPLLTGVDVPWPPANYKPDVYRAMAPLVQTRVTTMAEVVPMVDFLFLDDAPRDDAAFAKAFAAEWATDALNEIVHSFESCEWTADAIKSVVERTGELRGVKLGKVQAPVRVAVTGRSVGPPLFESIELLGRDETVRRIRHALATA